MMARGSVRHATVGGLFVRLLISRNASWSASKKRGDWTMLRNERHSFLIGYPVGVVLEQVDQTSEEGLVFNSDCRGLSTAVR
jgi:hypothetical protein